MREKLSEMGELSVLNLRLFDKAKEAEAENTRLRALVGEMAAFLDGCNQRSYDPDIIGSRDRWEAERQAILARAREVGNG